MQNEIPNEVKLVVRNGESQADFARRLFMEAARVAGMPLLEQVSFAEYMIKSGEHLFVGKDEKPRLKWREDPSPKDNNPLVSDKEWKAKYGQWHTHTLGDFNKQELKRRQVYYALGGGILGSGLEAFKNDIIIVPLNITFESPHFDETTAAEYLKSQVQDAIDAYGQINIKFYVTYRVGTATEKASDGTLARIATGTIEGAVNVYLFYDNNAHRDRSYMNSVSDHIFLMKSGFYKTDGMRVGALSHEIGHVFGFKGWQVTQTAYDIFGERGNNWFFNSIDNLSDFAQIEPALTMMRNGLVRKDIDWVDDYTKAVQLRSVRAEEIYGQFAYIPRKPTLYDLLRAGARKIAGK